MNGPPGPQTPEELLSCARSRSPFYADFAVIDAFPTLESSQADDLKAEAEDCRVWLSRTTLADCEADQLKPNEPIGTFEYREHDAWVPAEWIVCEGPWW